MGEHRVKFAMSVNINILSGQGYGLIFFRGMKYSK